MNPSVKAILARFNGDRKIAVLYCVEMAKNHPRLAEEYIAHQHALVGELGEAAHA